MGVFLAIFIFSPRVWCGKEISSWKKISWRGIQVSIPTDFHELGGGSKVKPGFFERMEIRQGWRKTWIGGRGRKIFSILRLWGPCAPTFPWLGSKGFPKRVIRWMESKEGEGGWELCGAKDRKRNVSGGDVLEVVCRFRKGLEEKKIHFLLAPVGREVFLVKLEEIGGGDSIWPALMSGMELPEGKSKSNFIFYFFLGISPFLVFLAVESTRIRPGGKRKAGKSARGG